MLNIHGDILDLLNESEYYLFSILLNYGTKSCPDNSVLLHRTGWGLNKLQTAKKSLISKGLLKVEARFNPTKGAKGRESNAYVITTDLASKYNDKLIRNKLVNNKNIITMRLLGTLGLFINFLRIYFFPKLDASSINNKIYEYFVIFVCTFLDKKKIKIIYTGIYSKKLTNYFYKN